ncbi:SMC family ATPase [Enterococcus gilvus]|uniref:SMC family ATPase n=1 Tax=Enterococcus gilvus TaxID=160453 RepID=UPI00290E8595|nr:SMC family ATPase [Enterococcus gilvus]MDU5512214.1 SMC family ATPase [Enterococcus gilvus]
MLPKKIIMENFGPFLHEEVNFEEMTEAPLFLISGKTGAGKTTIFDAITFALYGDASGGIRSSNEIRSSFAEPTEETRVQFIFEHQGRSYAIERWPKQTLAKKNGKGETTKNQKVQLSIFDDTGKEAEAYTKVDAVNEVIYQILHLQKDQFRQIVMLPQGEFRTFLNANSTEKEAVLRSLFGTNVYRQFTENLKLKKAELEKGVSELTTRIDQLFQQVLAEKGATYEESLIFAEGYLSEEAQALTQKKVALVEKQTQQKTLLSQVQKAEKVSESFKSYRQTQEQLQEVEADLPENELRKRRLSETKEIEKLRPTYDRIQELLKIQAQQTIEENENKRLSEELVSQSTRCQKQSDLFEEQRSDWQAKEKELQSLESFLPLVRQKEELVKQKNDLTQKLAQQHEQLARLNQEITRQLDKQATLKEKQNSEKFWQERRYEELQFQQKIAELKESAKHIFEQQEAEESQQIELAQLVEKVSSTSNQLTSETAEYKKLKSQWASAEIARLSMDLLPGEPCPVCGSKEHPNPAQHKELTLDNLGKLQVALETQEARLKQLELIREQTEARYELSMTAFDTLQADRLSEQQSLLEKIKRIQRDFETYYQKNVAAELEPILQFLEERQNETADALAEISKANQDIQELAAGLEKNETEKHAFETSIHVLQGENQRIEGRLASVDEQTKEWEVAALEARISDLKQRVEEYHGQLDAHQALVKEVEQKRIRLHEQQRFLEKQQQDSAKTLESYQTSLNSQLAEKGLTIDQVKQPPANVSLLEQEISDFEQRVLVLRDRQKQLEETLQGQVEPDMEQLKKLLTESDAEVALYQQQYYAKENQLMQQRDLVTKIKSLQEQSKDKLTDLSQIIQLYQTMNGDNPQKISLERYVLQWYLAEVLKNANQQLKQLTKGRYQFELKQETGRSKGNTGLEINVYDDNAGATRSSHTLSGGESFIAALSLALGLAEVIQNQAGGVAIEALFIDEGFGSLDEEALEMAMEALEGIESAGRMIGIISHVRELKERIPQQIVVETSGTGRSSIRYQLEGWSEA